jgi:AraC family transcriptional regulator
MTEIRRRVLFESASLRIGHVLARGSTEPGDVQRQDSNVIVLPVRGIFTKHDAPRRQVTGTPSHAVFIAAERPYRLSFPGRIGDECLTVSAPRELDFTLLDPHALLPAEALIARGILWRELAAGDYDPLEVEESGLSLLSTVVAAATSPGRVMRRETAERRARQVERVKEAVGVEPQRRWTIGLLAALAGASAYHLARVFREEVGVTVHRYVMRARLALALERVLDGERDLAAVAMESGFTSHSHFTARFHRLFGLAPSQLRKIVTAPLAAHA